MTHPLPNPARKIVHVLILLALAMGGAIAETASAATEVCDAAAFACPPEGTCVIRRTWRVGSNCTLDFGTRAVEIRGTLRAAQRGGSFSIAAGDLTLAGGTLESRGNREEFAGNLAVFASGAFSMRGEGSRITVSGEGGGGSVVVDATQVDLTSGIVSAVGGRGEECGDGGEIVIRASGPLHSNASVRATAAGSFCAGGVVSLEGTATTVSRPIDVRGGALGGDIFVISWANDGDAVIAPSARLRADGNGQDEGIGADGGTVVVSAGRDVRLGAAATANARAPHGIGGSVVVEADGKIDVDAPASAVGSGDGSGGTILINGLGDVTVRTNLGASLSGKSAFASAGTIQVRSGMRLETRSIWDVSGPRAGSIVAVGNPLVMSGAFLARGGAAQVSVEGCRADLLGTIDALGLEPIQFGGIVVATGALNVGPAARLVAGPCADEQCVSLTTRPGGLSIAPGAVLDPAPLIAEDASLPGC